MLTELLFWDKKEERLYTDKKVTIETEGQLITGLAFEADQEFNNTESLRFTAKSQ